MNDEQQRETHAKRILARVAAEDFVGREAELAELRHHASGEREDRPGLLLLAAPVVGASELLRQTFDQLFYEQTEIVPFYFSFSRADKTARRASIRFLREFLIQTIAFRRRDAQLLSVSPDVCEISDLAAAQDAHWIHQLLKTCRSESEIADETSFIRGALSAPLRAAVNDARAFVMLDDLHQAENLSGETDLLEQLKEIFSQAEIPFVFAGRRRFILNAARTGNAKLLNAKLLHLAAITDQNAAVLMDRLSEKYDIKINDETRDLIIQQFQSNPVFIAELFAAARESGTHLDSFFAVQTVAIDALFGGSFARRYDALFDEIAPQRKVQTRIIKLLRETLESSFGRTPFESWEAVIGKSPEEVYKILRHLHTHEIARINGSSIEPAKSENPLLSDYTEARYRLEILSEPRALVLGESLSRALIRAPQIMRRFYRRASALNLKKLLAAFKCQSPPAALFDYAAFKQKFKGAPDEEILAALELEKEKIILPQTVVAAGAEAFYPPISQVAETERAAVAIGFDRADYREENEITWVAAQIDSKLEATQELTEFWCDRLEMIAVACDFSRSQLWLITPEGFTDEAMEILRQRGVYGSSQKQIELLASFLKAGNVAGKKASVAEYELILPMSDETEMIAAQAVEEIARRHQFKPAAINQIKTALVEACINAAEHSLSPDRKIYQKFKVEEDRIVITIANRGVKIPAEKISETAESNINPSDGRRGWGLKLMRQLMDEVDFEQTDDGTRISMTKYKKKDDQ